MSALVVSPFNWGDDRRSNFQTERAGVTVGFRALKQTCVLNFPTDDSTKVSEEKNY